MCQWSVHTAIRAGPVSRLGKGDAKPFVMKTVLAGVDFSEHSELAAKQALGIARHVGARLVLAHAGTVPDAFEGIPEAMASTADIYRDELNERLSADRDRLEELRQRLSGQGAEVSHVVVEGFADTAIVEAAEEFDAGLVVVGTQGLTGVRRFLLGSVAERVVRLCRRSVLVARSMPAAGYRRILVPIDFAGYTPRVIEAARTVAAPGARFDLMYCWHLPPLASSTYAPPTTQRDVIRSLAVDIVAHAERKASELVSKLFDASDDVNISVVEAPPKSGIADRLASEDYDLVVMGSHGRRGIRRWVLGSVAEVTVRHAPCSTLVVHGGERD